MACLKLATARHDVKGNGKGSVSVSDFQLVQKFLQKTLGMTDQERAAAIDVGVRTVARWKAGEVKPLLRSVRERIEVYLAENASEADREAAVMVITELRRKLDELESRLTSREPAQMSASPDLDLGQDALATKDVAEGLLDHELDQQREPDKPPDSHPATSKRGRRNRAG